MQLPHQTPTEIGVLVDAIRAHVVLGRRGLLRQFEGLGDFQSMELGDWVAWFTRRLGGRDAVLDLADHLERGAYFVRDAGLIPRRK